VSRPQLLLEKLLCHYDQYSHMGSGVPEALREFSGHELVSDESTIELWEEELCLVLHANVEKRPSTLLSVEAAKVSVCVSIRVHRCPWHMCDGTTDAEEYLGILETDSVIKTTYFPGISMIILVG